MQVHHPRLLLLRVLFLDWLGQTFIFALFCLCPEFFGLSISNLLPLKGQGLWFIFCLLLYPILGWLFGSFTVLRWRRLSFKVLFHRLFITSTATLIVVAIARWLANTGDEVWLVFWRVQLVWFGSLMFWSLIVRFALRRGLLLPDAPRLLLLASESETSLVLKAWARVLPRQRLEPCSPSVIQKILNESAEPILLAISPSSRLDPNLSGLIKHLETQHPCLVKTSSVTSLFQQQQERLPPALLAESALSYEELPWSQPFSVQVQLKRLSDLFVAATLLVITAPFIALSALLIWLEDQGSVFYLQQRSGWLGRPFTMIKLRTMREHSHSSHSLWTQPGDQRITVIGHWLRRLRLDELPQLLNVLKGEMSLIGPRPERPELEHDLERHIPHYRKRHWMRPGLSGWAQVCAPYASSVEDSDLKLSYDLYYLRHFSTWLDLVILFRTIKTVLKAGGR